MLRQQTKSINFVKGMNDTKFKNILSFISSSFIIRFFKGVCKQ